MNIIISSWPGAGASTLCFLLSDSLNIALLRGSSVFREISKAMNFAATGIDRINSDEYLEDNFSTLYDKYIKYKVSSDSNFIVETDIIKRDSLTSANFLAVFLTAPYNVRAKRLVFDQRDKDSDLLKERDNSLKVKYSVLYGYNWFDTDALKANYDLIVDNSELTLASELKMVYRILYQKGSLTEMELNDLNSKSETADKMFFENGKEFFINKLDKKNLIMHGDDVVKEINSVFSAEVSKLPEDIRNAINSICYK